MEKFDGQAYRDDLSEKLINTDKDERAAFLADAQDTPEYKIAHESHRSENVYEKYKGDTENGFDLAGKLREYFYQGKVRHLIEERNANPENVVYETDHVSINIKKGDEGKFIFVQELVPSIDITWEVIFSKENFNDPNYDANVLKENLDTDTNEKYFLARTYSGIASDYPKKGVNYHAQIFEEFVNENHPYEYAYQKTSEAINVALLKKAYSRIMERFPKVKETKWILRSAELLLEQLREFCTNEELNEMVREMPVIIQKGEKTGTAAAFGGGYIKIDEDGQLEMYGKSEGFGSSKSWEEDIVNLLEKELPGKIKQINLTP